MSHFYMYQAAHLKKDVCRVQISMTDATLCDVFHATCNAFHEAQNRLEAVWQLLGRQRALLDQRSQCTSTAELLHVHALSSRI